MGRPLVVAFCAAAALAAAPPSIAQVGRVAGTVRDEAGKPLKGAAVTAHAPEQTPPTFTASTDGKGRFAILGLRRGSWTVTVQMPGFETTAVRADISTMRPNAPIDVRLARAAQPAPAGPLAGVNAADLQRRIDAAEALAASGDPDGAIAAYREILTRVPALTSVYLRLGALHEQKHDTAAALDAYRELARIDPGNVRARAAIDRLSR